MNTVCPCVSDGGANLSPALEFIGHDYFCESGNKDPTVTPGQLYSDTLWDGKTVSERVNAVRSAILHTLSEISAQKYVCSQYVCSQLHRRLK